MKRLLALVILGSVTHLFQACGVFQPKTEERVRDVPEFFTYKHINAAPKKISEAARAVVRIGTQMGAGTGFFISQSGLLMTNNHVVGTDNCSIEGCYLQLTFGFERGNKADSNTYFAEPLFSDTNLDVSVFQIRDEKGGPAFRPPHFLKVVHKTAPALMGERLYFVGHPGGELKKWVATEVVDYDKIKFSTDNLALGGSSGSPYLNADGDVVGILHSTHIGSDNLTRHGYSTVSFGTSSSAILEALGSDSGSLSIYRANQNQSSFKNPSVLEVNEDNAELILTILSNSRKELPSTSTVQEAALLGFAEQKCDDFLGENKPIIEKLTLYCYQVPIQHIKTLTQDRRWKWDARMSRFADVLHDANHSSSALRVLQSIDQAIDDDSKLVRRLKNGLQRYGVPLSFELAEQLTDVGILNYEGKHLQSYIENYSRQAHFEKYYVKIIFSMFNLNQLRLLGGDVIKKTVARALGDGNITLGDYLIVEAFAYRHFPDLLN